ncbi:MAG: putative DNA binding domain-containing protein [Thermoguttaceae bacterium]|nr:putative DNA binding domain-containing protein [Thermoguttaceae bacterium]
MKLSEIRRGESAALEFKSEFPSKDKSFLKTVVAFANGSGGRILIGVGNDGRSIVGVDGAKALTMIDSIANMIADSCEPQIIPNISLLNIQDKTVIQIEIFKGLSTPYFLKKWGMMEGVFFRSGATTVKAQREKVLELLLLGKRLSYDEQIDRGKPASEGDIRFLCETIARYHGEPAQKLTVRQLAGWKLLQKEEKVWFPSIAFNLLTCNDHHFATIQCALFKGTERVEFLDRKEFAGPIFEQIESSYQFALAHLDIGAKIEGLLREDVYEIPPAVIRELIVNAVVHRNYLLNSSVQVSIFDDRVEIQSPGGLFNGLTKEDMLSGCSSIRNTLIAETFQKMRIVEKWGTGIRRVFELCREAGIPAPKYDVSDNFVNVTIRRVKAKKNVRKSSFIATGRKKRGADLPKELPSVAKSTFLALRKNSRATAEQLSRELGVSLRTVKEHIRVLKSAGMIQRVGGNKGGYWVFQGDR